MTTPPTISEKVSETPKRKRGRPRSFVCSAAYKGCYRTKVDWTFHLAAVGLIRGAGTEAQRAVWGCTRDEIMAGTGTLPKGWKTAAISIGRYLAATDDDPARVAGIVAKARRDGISFGDIAAHFRRLRLGEREGNATSLTLALERALDEYRRSFPKTTDRQALEALQNVADAVQESSRP